MGAGHGEGLIDPAQRHDLGEYYTPDWLAARLDRLARSVRHLLDIVETLKAKGADLRIINLNLDTGTATGKLLFTMIGAIAEFEREMMLERQREGIAKAKRAGKYKGRKPTARAKENEIARLKAQGVGAAEIARRLGIGRASVYRVLAGPTSQAQHLPEREVRS